MCIIGLKTIGQETPSLNTLRGCFNSNRDGAGIAIVRNDKVEVHKGFMNWGDFETAVNVLQIDKNELAMYHFRFGTAGENNQANTHPFPVWPVDKTQLRWTSYTAKAAMSHNGIMSKYGGYWKQGKVDEYSDTQLFVYDQLRHYTLADLYTNETVKELGTLINGGNKLAIITEDNKYILVNEQAGVWDQGMWWSNPGYKIYC